MRVQVTSRELEVVAGDLALQIHRPADVDEPAAGNGHLAVDRHVAEESLESERSARVSVQAKGRRSYTSERDER